MDFSYLLELAKANEAKSKVDDSFKFSTKVSNAKKVNKPGPKSDAVNQFLNKVEDDKKKKEDEYNKKKQELLALREKDKHSKKRVKSLINRTKGASKSVLEDAKDITTAVGEEQCDEDDYGYESAISQQIFSKLQNKYCALPEDERLKFSKTPKSSIEDIKNRVMSSLKKEQEEELGIRKRTRKRKSIEEDDGFINDGDAFRKFSKGTEDGDGEKTSKHHKSKENQDSSKSKKKAVDLSNFNPKVDKYSHFKYDKDKQDKERKEKQDKEKKKVKAAPPPMSFEQLMKVAQKKQLDPIPIVDPLKELLERKEKSKKEEDRPLTAKEKKEFEEDKIRRLKKMWKLSNPSAEKETSNSKEEKETTKNSVTPDKNDKSLKEKVVKVNNPKMVTAAAEQPPKLSNKSKYFAVPKPPPDQLPKTVPAKAIQKTMPKPAVVQKPSINNPIQSKVAQVPKKERAPIPKPVSSPPSFVRRHQPPPLKNRRIDSDEDSEYDSEMDDFIDDGDADIDYSNEIAKMFKYDKSKYSNMDDDVDDMEASYSQLQKEERISAKIGLMEDLEDMRREEEEKKRKKVKRK